MLSSIEIVAQEQPLARSAATFEASSDTLGRPNFLPLAREFRSPARTLSAVSDRSNSPSVPKTVKIIRPAGAVVSICSDRLTNPMLKGLKAFRHYLQCLRAQVCSANYSFFDDALASHE